MAYVIPIDLVNQLRAVNDYVVIPFGASTEQVWTLNTYLAQWAAGAITEPGSLQGDDPTSQAAALAQSRCAAIPATDCNQAAQLAQQYGQTVANAIAAGGYSGNGSAAAAAPAPAPAVPVAPAPAATPSAAPAGAAATTAPAPHFAPSAPAAAAAPALAPALHARFLTSGGGDGGGGVGGGIGTVISTALDYIPIIGPILGGIASWLFGGSDISGLTKAVKQLSQEVTNLGDSITRFTWSVADGLGGLWEADALIWDNFIDQFWTNFKNVWKALWKHLAETIPTILKILHDGRQLLDKIYQKYIRPLMNWIQLLRRWLTLLKLLHVPFAQKLDKILTQIQGAVFTPFLYVLRWLNGYGAWYNVILTADLILQKPVFLRTMYAYQGEWINLWWAAQSTGHTLGASSPSSGAAAPPSDAEVISDVNVYATTGGGPMAFDVAQARALTADLFFL